MKAMSLLMAINIRDGKYSFDCVPSRLKEQVQEQLKRLEGDE